MSTRSYIGKEVGSNQYKAMYCGHDGYLDHVGRILLECYNTSERVDRLIALNEINALGERLPNESGEGGVTEPYQDARPAEVLTKEELEDLARNMFAADYIYLFTKEEKWMCFRYGSADSQWYDLEEILQDTLSLSGMNLKMN